MEDSSAVITGYQVTVTRQESGFSSQQLNTSNTSINILIPMGEYLAQVVAMNCAGASQASLFLLIVSS